eukprot:GSChrysophyteH1.ASY1.ANO1.2668.1 assembled CDS
MPSNNLFQELADSSDGEDAEDSQSNSGPFSDDIQQTKQQPKNSASGNAASGGDVAIRVDPLVTANANLSGLDFTDLELSATERVVAVLSANTHLFKLPQLRPLRKALAPLSNPNKRKKQQQRNPKLKEMERNYINQTQLRAIRLAQLEKLNDEQQSDGVVTVVAGVSGRLRVTENADESLAISGPEIELTNPQSCYICRKPYLKLHFFYAQLCPDCAEYNFKKRDEVTNMVGKVCLVTGARAKIGFRCALKLLRCGATVIATTRFPVAGSYAFLEEPDSADWRSKLHVYGLDFRNLVMLENFLKFVNHRYTRLDVIINNACQTVRRPPAYYTRMMEAERTPWEDLGPHQKAVLAPDVTGTERKTSVVTEHGSIILPENSAESSQLAFLSSDTDHSKDTEHFPNGLTDVNGAQVDLRNQNSWTLRLHEVSTNELAEVMAINAMAPALINARLKSLMEKTDSTVEGSEEPEWKFVVNVSAMEGKFYRYKTKNHPHTNMAKASLNMMTRTSAADYVTSHIYMTAVDTGWINDEKPLEAAVKHEKKHNFQTPIDEIDAAARVLDPVIAPLLGRSRGETPSPPFGVFLKDFQKCEW